MNMLLKYFIVVLLTLHVINAEESSTEQTTSLKNSSKNELKTRQRDLETTIHEKFKKLEKNIIDTLEEYLDGKLEMLQKQVYHKIEVVEENIPSKTDIFGIERDLEALKNGSIACGSSTSENGLLAEINQKLIKVQSDISKLEVTFTSVTSLAENLNNSKVELRQVVEEVIKPELDALNRKIPENFENSTNFKFEAVEKQIVEFHKNVSEEFETLKNTLSQKLDEIQNVFPILEENINNTLDAIKNTSCGHNVQPAGDYSQCKSRTANGFDFVPISINSLDHSTVEYDSDGYISNFQTRFAVKGSNLYTHVSLATTDQPSSDVQYYLIDFVNNQETRVRSVYPVSSSYSGVNLYETMNTGSGIQLSEDTYTAINLKINRGVLELKLEGSSTTFVHYNEDRLKRVKYIGFTSWVRHNASFLYDCPTGFADYMRCQERVAEDYDFTAVDINTLQHTAVQHDASGLSRLEMHLAIKGSNSHTHIQLSKKKNPSEDDRYFVLDFFSSELTQVRSACPASNPFRVQFYDVLANTGGITLSTHIYTTLHLIIDNGILTMGLIGSPPVVRYEDSRLGEIKYIGFTAWNHHKAEFLYDCPAGFEESLQAASE